MFHHIMVGSNDIEASRAFYDATLGALGHKPAMTDPKGRLLYLTESGIFLVTQPIDGNPATHGNGCTLGFLASSEEAVNAWHEAGLANGGTACEDPPGIREGGGLKLYLAYLRDPAGNKLCATYRV